MATHDLPKGSMVIEDVPAADSSHGALPRAPIPVEPEDAFDTPAATEQPPETEPAAAPKSPWRLFQGSRATLALSALALWLVFIGVYDVLRFLLDVYQSSMLLGMLYSVLSLLVFGTIGWWIVGIIGELRAVNDVSALRARGDALAQAGNRPALVGEFSTYVSALATHYAGNPAFQAGLAMLPARLDQLDAERGLDGRLGIEELSTALFDEVDRQALALVVKRSQQTALMTAISRIPLLDLIIVLWRSLALIAEIAKLYGGRPGRVGLLRLARLSLYNVVFADISQIAADILMQAMGDRALSAISTQAAQGLGVGLMLGRLGLQAMHICRPVPFVGDEPNTPSFRKLYGAMTALIKQGMSNQPSDNKTTAAGFKATT